MWQIILIILVVLYILSPYDLLPDLIIGWGWLDDIVILGFLLRYFYNRKKKREAFQKYYQNSKNADHTGNRTTGNNQSRTHTREEESAASQWDPYQILEIERGASQEKIKQPFRKLAGKYHPDKLEYLGDEFKVLAEQRFKEIQRAYEELKSKK
jgi:DnaJ like chaperone protein